MTPCDVHHIISDSQSRSMIKPIRQPVGYSVNQLWRDVPRNSERNLTCVRDDQSKAGSSHAREARSSDFTSVSFSSRLSLRSSKSARTKRRR